MNFETMKTRAKNSIVKADMKSLVFFVTGILCLSEAVKAKDKAGFRRGMLSTELSMNEHGVWEEYEKRWEASHKKTE